ncbi:efflux RND transporter periplasmic adaptor subunit [Shinella sp. CPCC 101442]|uniref:efflux RND transporter periplasmic adaptor subunit n=1 Tax=Shinella sp. CPCC 101442 TaxID=2932265 RepID=UPI002153689A|nr:efflux RND transporter periplasmic adaptor subunit [Shinella sp. CPCC 101442]MCR6499879.1 efflux RND transporter periplasmic adaptor subunit [Shinella sp. CPCC 101442]
MRVWKQLLISLGVISAGVLLWGRFVPGANGMLTATGLPAPLVAAIAPASEEKAAGGNEGGGRRGGFGGGPTLVATKPVAMATVNDRLNAIGDGEAIRTVTVTPYATGNLTEVLVESGTRVEQGAVIARLDSDEQKIAADQARVTVEAAQQKLKRLENLRSSTSTADLQDAQTALKAAELALRNAELTLRRRDITAPYGGVVGIISVNPGDYVTTSTAIARIDDRSEILVDYWVPERFALSVKVGGEVSATAVARPGEVFTGKVQAIDNRIDQESRTLRVRARIANADDVLRAGMSFQVTMRFAGDLYPSVDPLSLQWSADGSYIWRVSGDKVERVPVHIVQRNPDKVLVKAALAEGDAVVVEGVQTLRQGGAVRTADERGTKEKPAIAEGT